jgi:hypothetical protein
LKSPARLRLIGIVSTAGIAAIVALLALSRWHDGRQRLLARSFREAHAVAKVFMPATGPLKPDPKNPRYFTDGSGRPIVLVGSHTWLNFQDAGHGQAPPAFDYERYLDFLSFYGHNFFRLWTWETPRWALQSSDDDYWFRPMPWKRTGPGLAQDGLPKFNLDLFDQSYFDRLHARCEQAARRGIYVSVMLFNGWAVAKLKASFGLRNPWRSHPFAAANNVNGVNGDADGNDSGEETQEDRLQDVWKYQDRYIHKVVDSVNDLDNVLFEVSNESHPASKEWQYRVIETVKAYEAHKPKQHPVGMTSYVGLKKPVSDLFDSPADWVSPNNGEHNEYASDPPVTDGRKIVILDTDHIWGIGGDRSWAWKGFTRGYHLLFMDGYDGENNYAVGGAGWEPWRRQWMELRKTLGYIESFANRMNLRDMTPRPELSSTRFCLASVAPRAEYLIYQPVADEDVQVNLAGVDGLLQVEWFNPETGYVEFGLPVSGGATRLFRVPFHGDAVLYLQHSAETAPKTGAVLVTVVGDNADA